MVRSAIADDNFLSYMVNLSKSETCTVGLILGQPTQTKDYIIHFAKTPSYNADANKSPVKPAKKFTDVADGWVADHAKHVTRMLPGGMYVLGIFVVSHEDILKPFSPKIKTMLSNIHRKLSINKFLYGNPNNSEKLVLNYCVKTQSYSCKSYDIDSSTLKPAEIKFQPKLTVKWLQIECKYELDQHFSIMETSNTWPLKKHVQEILASINENLQSGVFIYDGEIKDGDDCLELVGKKKKVPRAKSGHHESGDVKPMQVTIMLPYDVKKLKDACEIQNCDGQIRIVGHVACKIWLHPKASINDASQAVVQDIVRSLTARLEMHWDSLIEEEHGTPEDTNSIHEPPRRVLVDIPNNKVTLSDYLFPGEGPQEAKISLQELLDIKISEQDAIKDIEGQAELTDLYNEGLEVDSDEILQKLPKTTNKPLFMTAVGVVFLALFISLVMYIQQKYF